MSPAPRILVTGFSAFPGSRQNPTASMIERLQSRHARFARAGLGVAFAVLPVSYAETGLALAALAKATRPDAIIHFGVAPRRRMLCIETRAANRVSRLRPDASGACAADRTIARHAPPVLRATAPCLAMAAALRGAGFPATISIDAGDYLCNQTLFQSLAAPHAPLVGFIHVPPPARLGPDAATRAATVAILALAPLLRRGG